MRPTADVTIGARTDGIEAEAQSAKGVAAVTGWTTTELDELGRVSEIRIATRRLDGSVRTPLPIWVVRVGDQLFVRSYHGPKGSWFRQVSASPYARVSAVGRDLSMRLVPADQAIYDAVDRAYLAKYGRGGFGSAMTTPAAAATTLRLEPGAPGLTTRTTI